MPQRFDDYDRVAVVTGSDSGTGISAPVVDTGFDQMTGNEDVDPATVERPGIPVGRPGHAAEVTAVVTMLAAPSAAHVTGSSVVVDGGMLLMGPQAGSHLPTGDWRDG